MPMVRQDINALAGAAHPLPLFDEVDFADVRVEVYS